MHETEGIVEFKRHLPVKGIGGLFKLLVKEFDTRFNGVKEAFLFKFHRGFDGFFFCLQVSIVITHDFNECIDQFVA